MAALIAKFLRKEKWWLKVHKGFNQVKTFLAFAGIITAIIMVQSFNLKHFSSLHGLIGLIAFIFILIQSTIGFLITFKLASKLKFLTNNNNMKLLGKIHKSIGFFVILLILENLILGLLNIIS